MFEYIDITKYGNTNKKHADLIINCPHGANSGFTLDLFPDLISVLEVNEKDFKKYLYIEQDIGSHELSHLIAKNIVSVTKNKKRVDVIDVKLHRGIIDANRLKDRAIRYIYDFNKYPVLFNEMNNVYCELYKSLLSYFEENIGNGYYIDIHTMAPCNPLSTDIDPDTQLEISPNTILEYCFSYTKDKGRRRAIDLMVGLKESNEILADESIKNNISRYLAKYGFKYDYNEPYSLVPYIMSYVYTKKYKGIDIDIPKDYLSNESGESFKLDNITISETKLKKLAESLCKGILKVI